MMILTDRQKKTIVSIVNIFETGKVEGDYSSTEVLDDGAGITYGKSCTTLNSGNLYLLLKLYIDTPRSDPGWETSGIGPAFDRIKSKLHLFQAKDQALNTDKQVLSDLKLLGTDPVMHLVQDAFFDKTYFQPAFRACERLGLLYPLSCAVVYDSHIHGAFATVRKLFAEIPPAPAGGDEKKWTTAYVFARRAWLLSRKTSILRKTVYRMDTFLDIIENKNWMLDLPLKIRELEIR